MLKSTVISPTKGLKGERESSYLASVKFKVNVSRGFVLSSSTSYASTTQGKPQLKPCKGVRYF